jgi:hypothetical protein
MANETISAYITTQRARGCVDELIREELRRSGWKDDDINSAFSMLEGLTMSSGLLNSNPRLRYVISALSMGIALLTIGLAILLSSGRFDDFPKVASVCFFLASITFIPSAAYLFFTHWCFVKNIWYRIWIFILGLAMVSFVPVTTTYFGAFVFIPNFQNVMDNLDDSEIVLLVNFFFLLPAQVIVYALATLNIFFHRRYAIKREVLSPPKEVMYGYLLMILAAVLGVVGLWITLENAVWI